MKKTIQLHNKQQRTLLQNPFLTFSKTFKVFEKAYIKQNAYFCTTAPTAIFYVIKHRNCHQGPDSDQWDITSVNVALIKNVMRMKALEIISSAQEWPRISHANVRDRTSPIRLDFLEKYSGLNVRFIALDLGSILCGKLEFLPGGRNQ